MRSRRFRRLLISTVVVAGVLPAAIAPSAVHAVGPTVGVLSSMTNVRPTGTPAGMAASVSLVAARNETESFQIVVVGGATGVTGVSATGNLFGWNTTSLSRVGYYNATIASDREGATGEWPNELIPTVDLMYGQPRNAFPFTVAANRNQVIWVDVAVPSNARPGLYRSSVSVTSPGGTTVVPVNLEVLDFTMPVTSSLRSAFFNIHDRGLSSICLAHTGNGNCASATQKRTLHSLYSRLALDNRVTIANGSGLNYGQSPANGDSAGEWESLYESPLVRAGAAVPATARWRLAGATSTAISQFAYASFHCASAACADSWEAEANEAGQNFASRFVWYGCDEPGGSAAMWAACATNIAIAKGAWNAAALVTASIDEYNAFKPAAMPTMQSLVVNIRRMEDKSGQYAGNQRSKYDAFLGTAGNQVWLYSGCDSFACGSGTAADNASAYYDGWPGYAIDAPAVQHRAMSWMAYKYSTSGELYYAVDQALGASNTSNGLYVEGAQGDGTLFAPGVPSRIGGTAHIPLETIRLKRIRDGREDYELMRWLATAGRGAQVQSIVNTLFPTSYSATAGKDGAAPGSLIAARAQLVSLARTLLPNNADLTRIAFSSNRDGDFELFTMRPDGGDVRQLTVNTVADQFPAWSPNGSRIAWTQAGDVWTMASDGAAPVNLTADIADVAEKPAWTSDGTAIIFVRRIAGRMELWRMAASNGASKTGIVTFAMTSANVYDPMVTSAGVLVYSQAAGTNRADLYTATQTGTGRAALTTANGAGVLNEVADAANTSTALAVSRSINGAQYDVSVLTATGALTRTISTSVGGTTSSDFQSTFAPNDVRLAMVTLRDGDSELWRVNADGTGAVQLTANTFADLDPDWGSPVVIR